MRCDDATRGRKRRQDVRRLRPSRCNDGRRYGRCDGTRGWPSQRDGYTTWATRQYMTQHNAMPRNATIATRRWQMRCGHNNNGHLDVRRIQPSRRNNDRCYGRRNTTIGWPSRWYDETLWATRRYVTQCNVMLCSAMQQNVTIATRQRQMRCGCDDSGHRGKMTADATRTWRWHNATQRNDATRTQQWCDATRRSK